MATRFQCDVCGGIGDPKDHTHSVIFYERRPEYGSAGVHRRTTPVGFGTPINTRDQEKGLELCEACNDLIRSAVNELSGAKKALKAKANAGSEEEG